MKFMTAKEAYNKSISKTNYLEEDEVKRIFEEINKAADNGEFKTSYVINADKFSHLNITRIMNKIKEYGYDVVLQNYGLNGKNLIIDWGLE